MVPDSASTATALMGGIKVNLGTIGLDASVQNGDCEASLRPETRVESLAALALRAGKGAGNILCCYLQVKLKTKPSISKGI